MNEIKIAKEQRPAVAVVGDAFGCMHIMLEGRTFITINYLAPWVDNRSMRSLASQIVRLLNGDEGPACATTGDNNA